MSAQELRTELCAEGVDPEKLVRNVKETISKYVRREVSCLHCGRLTDTERADYFEGDGYYAPESYWICQYCQKYDVY